MRTVLRRYLLFCGLAAHLLGGVALTYLLALKLEDHWRTKAVARWLEGEIDSSPLYSLKETSPGHYSYLNIPKGKWLKIHQQSSSDRVQFSRQIHSGSVWDSKRHQLIIVGSDTHGENWDNSLYFFNLERLLWRQAYQPDSIKSYRINADGAAVAGLSNPHPWAMHVFDALNYNIIDDTVILASYPGHLKNKYFVANGAPSPGVVKYHPTWIYDLSENEWRIWHGKPVHFFPYASAYDTDRNTVIGFRPDGVFEFRANEGAWNKIAKRSVEAWHTQAVYDEKHNSFVIFGTNSYGHSVYRYRVGDTQSIEMPTPGERPPGASSPPLAYNNKIEKVVALVDLRADGGNLAQTWLYDVGLDRWQYVSGADFPFKLGMNYHMQYAKEYDLLVLLASAPPEPPSIWVLRL